MDHVLLGILLINLVVVGAIAIKQLGVTQAPQIISMVVVLALGLYLGISWAGRRNIFIRAFFVIAGIAGAAAAWWFVPTLAGMNRWTAEHEARRLLAELESMPLGDGAAYTANAASRHHIAAEFPEYQARFEGPSKQWEMASVTEWTRRLDELDAGDISTFAVIRQAYQDFATAVELEESELAWFSRTYTVLKPGDTAAARSLRSAMRNHPYWDKKIGDWESDWAMRTVSAAIAETEPNISNDPIRVSVRLHQLARDLSSLATHPKAQEKLTSARRNAFQASLTATQRKALDLARLERYLEAEAATQHLKRQLGDEATALGMELELSRIVDSYGFLADLAKQAGTAGPK